MKTKQVLDALNEYFAKNSKLTFILEDDFIKVKIISEYLDHATLSLVDEFYKKVAEIIKPIAGSNWTTNNTGTSFWGYKGEQRIF